MERTVQKGSLVLLSGARKEMLVRVDGEMISLGGKEGALATSSLVGKPWGSKVSIGRSELTVLEPDVMDILTNLDRGAQIVTPKDSSAIVLGLGLSSGMTVVEGGAGSGALSIALLNAVRPNGKVITFEVRDDHLLKAGDNIRKAGLDPFWEGRLGDVCSAIVPGADAFVIDIPEPERAVGAAWDCLRPGGRFCSYIPTMNQMEKVFTALEEKGFRDVKAREIIVRDFSIKAGATRPNTEMLGHTGYMVFARKMS